MGLSGGHKIEPLTPYPLLTETQLKRRVQLIMLTPKKIKNIIQERGLAIQRARGQNFLIDRNVIGKMVRLSEFAPFDTVVEIGAGLGNITESIAQEARQVFAVEIDHGYCRFVSERFNAPLLTIAELKEKSGREQGELVVIEGDALEFDPGLVADEKRGVVVFGNLPYCETSPILLHLLEKRDSIERVLITVQKEVGDRIVAKPGAKNKAYSRLSIMLQTYFETEVLMDLNRHVFMPKPDVDSVFLRLRKHPEPFPSLSKPLPDGFEDFFPRVVAQAFSKRRKMMRKLLPQGWTEITEEEWGDIFSRVGVESSQRGESLSIDEFHQLAMQIWLARRTSFA